MNNERYFLLLCIVYQYSNDHSASALSMSMSNNSSNQTPKGRRSFMGQAVTTAGLAGVASASFLTDHPNNCACADCIGSTLFGHPENCACGDCRSSTSFGLRPASANAIEGVQGKEEGAKTNAIKYAFEKQAEETNARLAKSGFPLDTKEEEHSKIQEGLASFSYEDAMGLKKTKSVNKGYGKK